MQTSSSPFLSVITPTHNRAHLLRRVWDGLTAQTEMHFEWVVADDGSTDNTEDLVAELACSASFRVLYVRASGHVGKARIDNEAVRRARGEFLIWCDSDDWLLPDAVACLRRCWESIPLAERDAYVGITALCASEHGETATAFRGSPPLDVTWNDLAEVHGVRGDMVYFVRTSAMREHPFPEVDLVIPEGVVWTALGDLKTRYLPEAVKFVEYQHESGISFSGVMAYNRGRAHALARTTRSLRHSAAGWRARCWRTITFLRYCWHGDIPLCEALRLWSGNGPALLTWASLPVAWMLAARDAMQGKVRKTHQQFIAANRTAVISVTAYGEP